MKLLFNRSKKFLVSLVIFALIITANFGLFMGMKKNLKNIYASEFSVEDNVSIDNKNFNNYDSTNGYPYKPNNFTFSANNINVKHGIINISENTFKNNYKKYELGKDDNPNRINDDDDNYCLMINSRDYFSSCGYTSNEITLSKNSHYYVSANVYTDNVDGASTLYLFNGSEVFATIPNINTHKSWQTYYFFVSTSEYEDVKLNLGLWLGSKETSSKSCVFFDSLSCGRISSSTITNTVGDAMVDGKNKFLTNNGNISYTNLAGDNILETRNVNATNFKVSETGNENAGDINYTVYAFTQDYVDGKTCDVLKVENKQANASRFETKDNFMFVSNKVYKVSIKVKATLDSGNAYLQLVEDKTDGKDSDVLTISSTSNKFEDGYVEYSFVVNSDAREDRNYKFAFGLGQSADSSAKGEAYFRDFKISAVPYTEYSNASSNQKTLDLSSSYSSSQTIGNFAFDLSQVEEISGADKVKVNAPTKWTISKSNTTYSQTAGVFNIKDYDRLDKTNLSSMYNPGFIAQFDSKTNNVLMLHNEMSDYLYATSDEFTMSKKSYYVLKVWVNSQVLGANEAGASIGLYTDNTNIATIDNIKTNGQWKEYTLAVKTGFEDIKVKLQLSLGNNSSNGNSNGYVFFDNCMLTTNESQYNAILDNKYDLSNPLQYKNADGSPKFFDKTSANELANVVVKSVNLNDDLSFDFASEDIENLKNYQGENKNIVYINSLLEEDYFRLDSKLKYSLTKDKYYKISVDVYTGYLASADNVAGAGISLSGITDSVFTKVVSNKTWTTYTFLVCPDADVTTQISLSLGSENMTAKGTVVFGGLTFEEITEKSDYTPMVANADSHTKVVGTVEKEEEKTEEDKKDNEINWLLLTSTLTAVAVIVSVMGVAFKKVVKPSKKHAKKSKVEYDRESTVLHQKYRKLAYLKRDKDVRALEKKVEALKQDRLDKEDKYKELLKKIREVKLHNRDGKLNGEVAMLNKELNHASRSVSKAGVTMNKLASEIAFMKTEGYLQTLEKRLRKQDEIAKQNGTSIEEILKNENVDVSLLEDNGLDEAIEKADAIIENKKEEARLEAERKEQERLEAERIEKERLEMERLEKERIELENAEREKLLNNENSVDSERNVDNGAEKMENAESTENKVDTESENAESETNESANNNSTENTNNSND